MDDLFQRLLGPNILFSTSQKNSGWKLTSNSFHQKKWCIILVPATIWQTLIFYRQRKCWKLCLKISWNHIIQTKMNLFLAGLAIWNHCVAASLHRPPSHRTMMYFSWNWGGIKLPRKPRKFSNEHLHKRFYNFLKFFYSLLKSKISL